MNSEDRIKKILLIIEKKGKIFHPDRMPLKQQDPSGPFRGIPEMEQALLTLFAVYCGREYKPTDSIFRPHADEMTLWLIARVLSLRIENRVESEIRCTGRERLMATIITGLKKGSTVSALAESLCHRKDRILQSKCNSPGRVVSQNILLLKRLIQCRMRRVRIR